MISGKLTSLTEILRSLQAVAYYAVITTYIARRHALMRLYRPLQWSDLADSAAQGQDKKEGSPPLCPPDAAQNHFSASFPPPFTPQGRLTLATPLQLACSLWCALSGGRRMSAAPCSPNEMPVNEGASGTVRVKKKKINFKKKEKEKLPGCSRTTTWVVAAGRRQWTCAQQACAGQAANFT